MGLLVHVLAVSFFALQLYLLSLFWRRKKHYFTAPHPPANHLVDQRYWDITHRILLLSTIFFGNILVIGLSQYIPGIEKIEGKWWGEIMSLPMMASAILMFSVFMFGKPVWIYPKWMHPVIEEGMKSTAKSRPLPHDKWIIAMVTAFILFIICAEIFKF